MGDQTAFFFRRYAAFPVQTALPTAGAVGYFLPLPPQLFLWSSTENVEEEGKVTVQVNRE